MWSVYDAKRFKWTSYIHVQQVQRYIATRVEKSAFDVAMAIKIAVTGSYTRWKHSKVYRFQKTLRDDWKVSGLNKNVCIDQSFGSKYDTCTQYVGLQKHNADIRYKILCIVRKSAVSLSFQIWIEFSIWFVLRHLMLFVTLEYRWYWLS